MYIIGKYEFIYFRWRNTETTELVQPQNTIPTTDQQHTSQFTIAIYHWTKHESGYLSDLVMTGRHVRLE
jgi:hypothetical protein